MHISATIITLNEEKQLRDCILSLKSVCDEIIVLDSQSKDNTVQIAQELGAKVFTQVYLGDGLQKIKAAQYTTYDWVLSIDADERLDENLKQTLKNLDYSNPKIAYAFRRRNFVGNHQIIAPGFYPNYTTRLYNKNCSSYQKVKAHAQVLASKVIKIPADIIHYTYSDYSHWMERLNYFSSRDAWANEQKKVTSSSIIIHSFGAFLKKLIFQGGIFKGVDGWTIAWTTALKTHMKYLKILENQEKNKINKTSKH